MSRWSRVPVRFGLILLAAVLAGSFVWDRLRVEDQLESLRAEVAVDRAQQEQIVEQGETLEATALAGCGEHANLARWQALAEENARRTLGPTATAHPIIVDLSTEARKAYERGLCEAHLGPLPKPSPVPPAPSGGGG